MVEIIQEAHPIQDGSTSLKIDSRNAPPNRYGVPQDTDQINDSQFLFLRELHNSPVRNSRPISSQFIQQSMYFLFFGKNIGISTEALTGRGSASDDA